MKAVTGRKRVLGAVLACIGLPVVLVLVDAVFFYAEYRSNGTIVSSGQEREYLLHVPASYDSTTPTPLVISMHGAAMWPAAQKETSQWNRAADEHGFIVVYPSGVSGDGPRVWNAERGPDLMKDVRFISDLIDTLSAAYTIDPTRVYANGLSNGGGMAFVLSCTLSDRVAAVGIVAGALFLPWSWCTDPRAVPLIAFHGTADRAAPYHGGSSWVARGPFLDIPTWVADGARKNRCAPDPIEAVVAPDVTRRTYTDCADSAAVVLYTIEGGGHSWPGGEAVPEWAFGRTSRGVDATNEMWTFFRTHRLAGRDSLPVRNRSQFRSLTGSLAHAQ